MRRGLIFSHAVGDYIAKIVTFADICIMIMKRYNNYVRPVAVALALGATALTSQGADLDLFGLSGKVKSLRIDYNAEGLEWSAFYEFDADGRLTVVDDQAFTTDRDADGRITTFTLTEEDEDGSPQAIVTSVAYNPSGRVAATANTSLEEEWTDTYTYSPDGLVMKRAYKSPDDAETFTYVYDGSCDSAGNWLQRTEQSETAGDAIVQTRTITYW